MEYLLNALWGGMELIYFYFFLGAYLPAKKSTRHRVVVFALAWIFTIVYTFFAPGQFLKLMLTTTMLFVVSRHLNNGIWYLHIIYIAIAWMVNGLIDHYRNHNNPVIAKSVMEKLHKGGEENE